MLESLLYYFTLASKSKWVVWPLVPALALIILAAEREILFMENLFDTERNVVEVQCDESRQFARTADGSCNDLGKPMMGAVGMRFGRNIDPVTLPKYVSDSEVLDPNPRTVSRELLTRDEFKPATQLNMLATAWIQFMVHDWFDHGDLEKRNPILVPVTGDDPDFKQRYMKVHRTKRDMTYDPQLDQAITYRNDVTHWWDGSQIYGSSQEQQNSLRSFDGGKLYMKAGRLPRTLGFKARTGFNKNWWVGLTLFHNMFVREHNRTADMLAAAYPFMDDQELFDKARLINTALMAKIHTIEWTPAILDNSVLAQGMYANWYGLGEGSLGSLLDDIAPYAAEISQMFGARETFDIQKMAKKAIYGIVGGDTDHYNVPYSLTEEFVSVYRMHPLLPDEIAIRSLKDNRLLNMATLSDVREHKAWFVTTAYGFDNLLYTFGTTHPGALTLNNYPHALQHLKTPTQGSYDLAAVDIIRDRERGIPRYNAFRSAIRLKPIDDFEDLYRRYPGDAISPEQQAMVTKLREVYGSVDKLDLMVGCLAESIRPDGYGFGETAFQIFTLMASRRLLSDRFFTTDFTAQVYTPEGINLVQTRTLKDVLQDNFPELDKEGLIPSNAFKPWAVIKKMGVRD